MSGIYRRINWGLEPITSEKLGAMTANDDYLFQNMITGFYNAQGVVRDSGLTLRAGYGKLINTQNRTVMTTVYYDRPFINNARPVIVHGLASDFRVLIWWGYRGLDQRAIPDHRGFIMKADQGPDFKLQFERDQHFSYLAIAPNG